MTVVLIAALAILAGVGMAVAITWLADVLPSLSGPKRKSKRKNEETSPLEELVWKHDPEAEVAYEIEAGSYVAIPTANSTSPTGELPFILPASDPQWMYSMTGQYSRVYQVGTYGERLNHRLPHEYDVSGMFPFYDEGILEAFRTFTGIRHD